MKEAPGDADFESAIEENQVWPNSHYRWSGRDADPSAGGDDRQEVIRKREKEIEELKKKIKAHDDLYRPVVAKEPPKPASGVGSNAEEQDRIDTGGAAGPGASQAAQPPSVTEGQEGGEGVYL